MLYAAWVSWILAEDNCLEAHQCSASSNRTHQLNAKVLDYLTTNISILLILKVFLFMAHHVL